MSVKAIEAEKLSKHYGKIIGIDKLDLEVAEGEIFGFIGPNGAGKSTTIRTLLDLIFPTSGSASIFGLDTVKESKKIKFLTGYLPAEVNYYYKMTVKELLAYSARFYPAAEQSRIDELTDRLELNTEMKIRDLSLGNKKKVSLIQALLHRPKLLILDEPTSGLDPLVQSSVFEILRQENEKGTTIFFSSHVLSDVEKLCSRVAIIQAGRIIKVETIDTLREKMLKRVRIEFKQAFDMSGLTNAGAIEPVLNHTTATFMYNGDMNRLIKILSTQEIVNLSIEEPSLEEVFLHYYRAAEVS
jgi:ABC-2 type transport system ATP-binding protein